MENFSFCAVTEQIVIEALKYKMGKEIKDFHTYILLRAGV